MVRTYGNCKWTAAVSFTYGAEAETPKLCVILIRIFLQPVQVQTDGHFTKSSYKLPCDKWVPVTTAFRVLGLRMEERPPMWRVAANILNKQSRTADEGWSSSLQVGRGANNASPSKKNVKYYSQGEMLPLETKQSGGKLLPHSGLRGAGECF